MSLRLIAGCVFPPVVLRAALPSPKMPQRRWSLVAVAQLLSREAQQAPAQWKMKMMMPLLSRSAMSASRADSVAARPRELLPARATRPQLKRCSATLSVLASNHSRHCFSREAAQAGEAAPQPLLELNLAEPHAEKSLETKPRREESFEAYLPPPYLPAQLSRLQVLPQPVEPLMPRDSDARQFARCSTGFPDLQPGNS